jgi:peptidoglycan/LPS O-acetylase OafA/YrhL
VWLAAFLGYGRQHLSRTNRWLAWSRESSYPIYILHQTVIIALAYFVVPQPWSPGSKYWLVLGATLAICVLLYEGVLRRFALLRVLFGIKMRHTPARENPPRMGDA